MVISILFQINFNVNQHFISIADTASMRTEGDAFLKIY